MAPRSPRRASALSIQETSYSYIWLYPLGLTRWTANRSRAGRGLGRGSCSFGSSPETTVQAVKCCKEARSNRPRNWGLLQRKLRIAQDHDVSKFAPIRPKPLFFAECKAFRYPGKTTLRQIRCGRSGDGESRRERARGGRRRRAYRRCYGGDF